MANAEGRLELPDGARGYHDPKRYTWIFSLFLPCVVLVGPGLFLLTGNAGLLWTPVVFFYTAMPLIDCIIGEDRSNPPEWAVPQLEADRFYRYVSYALVPILWGTFIFDAWFVSHHALPWYGTLAMGITGGAVCGFGLNLGHELGHKHNRVENWLAKLVLALGAYGHFTVEHNRGHHSDVATPHDCASARMGESIYAFALREIPGGVGRAWLQEKVRLEKQGKPQWSLDNQVLQPLLITLALYSVLLTLWGAKLVPFLFVTMLWGAFQLTSANYVEHYGLLRQRDANGRYERCKPHHSWNSNHVFSNWTMFHLQRHSDHHAHPSRRYQSLRHFEGLPTLPSGYWGMFVMAYIPPLWFRVMDRRLAAATERAASRINFQPRKRLKLMRKYEIA